MAFQKAVKYASFLRMSLAGPAGSGKTYTALTLATALADGNGVAVIDTEHGTARKYADLFTFDVDELDTFDPRNFVKSIRDAERDGYAVLVIDSLSHAWNGKGGLLEIVDSIATRKYRGNTFSAWKDAGIIEHDFIECILTSKIHTIVTMRSKMDHVSEKNEQTGRTEVKKLGMAPIQRDTMEYEFDIVGSLDVNNTLVVQKSRCRALSGQVIPQPDGKVIATLRPWLEGAEMPAPPETRQEAQEPPVSIERGKSVPTQESDVKTRLNALYDRAIALGKFTKAATPEESGKAFLKWVGEIVGANIANAGQITVSRLEAVEKYLDSAEAA